MRRTILFICGSLNQTTMMHKIARHIDEHDCFFTPFFADGLLRMCSEQGWLDFTILGGRHRQNTEAYLAKERLPVDIGGRSRDYDLIVTGTDVLTQKILRDKRVILVQEGMTEPEGLAYHLVRGLGLPRYLANTATTGLSNAYDLFCVASPGYRDLFIRKGVDAEKIHVTGIPNFDHVEAYLENDFPQRGYVLAATSPTRETFQRDDRPKFIKWVRQIAAGRQIIFKLHPNENFERSCREINQFAPEALVYTVGNVNHMIANCTALVTQYSTVTYIGLALGKEVHSYLDLDELHRLAPIQNGGASARRIADHARRLIELPSAVASETSVRVSGRRAWNISDLF